MNPRDEKILSVVHKRQKADYENYVPFAVIHKSFPWIDGAELSVDLQSLCNQGYLQSQNFPTEYSGFWYCLTSQGNREYERIKHDDKEAQKNRTVQLISALTGAIIGFLLNQFFRA